MSTCKTQRTSCKEWTQLPQECGWNKKTPAVTLEHREKCRALEESELSQWQSRSFICTSPPTVMKTFTGFSGCYQTYKFSVSLTYPSSPLHPPPQNVTMLHSTSLLLRPHTAWASCCRAVIHANSALEPCISVYFCIRSVNIYLLFGPRSQALLLAGAKALLRRDRAVATGCLKIHGACSTVWKLCNRKWPIHGSAEATDSWISAAQ